MAEAWNVLKISGIYDFGPRIPPKSGVRVFVTKLGSPVYAFEGFRLDTQRRVLSGADGQPISLTPRLFDALLYFVERPGELLAKEQLLENLWPKVVVEEHNLNKTVSELRRVLGEKPGEHKFIVTTPGRGYRFVADVAVEPSRAAEEDATRSERSAALPVYASTLETATTAAAPTWSRESRRYRDVTWWSAGIVAAVLLLYGFLWSSPEPTLRVTPWSVKKGTQWYPAWSPDSAATAFTTFGGVLNEPGELVIRRLNEPIATPVARRPAEAPGGVTQWTTGGKILFFDRVGLWSISPNGGQPEPVVLLDFQRLGITAWFRMAHVTGDGSTLAAFARDGDDSVAVWTATPPSGTLQSYQPAPFSGATYHGSPYLRLSRSGRQILVAFYAAGRGFEAWLLPFPAATRNPPRRVLGNVPIVGDSVEFSWLPDERHIVLAAAVGAVEEGLKRQLYLVDTQSGDFRVLTASFNNPSGPVVSPDGSKMIVHDARGDFDIVTLDWRTMRPTTVIATDRSEFAPAWAAEVNSMVYATDRSGASEIWLRQEQKPDRPLVTASDFTTATLALLAPTLSPQGERVIFHRVEQEADQSRLWISAVVRGVPEPLTDEQLTERAGSWSPDGNWYVYWASPPEGGRRTLKKVKTTGRATPETLLADLQLPQNVPVPIWSPDGNWILITHQGLTLVSADGSQPSRNLGSESMPCAFADHEPLLYCIRGSLGVLPLGEYALVEMDLQGNELGSRALPPELRPASPLSAEIRLSLTPDRLGVTYSVESVSRTLWLVEGLDKVPLP